MSEGVWWSRHYRVPAPSAARVCRSAAYRLGWLAYPPQQTRSAVPCFGRGTPSEDGAASWLRARTQPGRGHLALPQASGVAESLLYEFGESAFEIEKGSRSPPA